MNLILSIFKWLGAGSPKKQNVTGMEAMGWPKARLSAMQGFRVSRFNEKPNEWFVEWDNTDKVFREGSTGSKTRKLYVPEDNMGDMVSCDWYIL